MCVHLPRHRDGCQSAGGDRGESSAADQRDGAPLGVPGVTHVLVRIRLSMPITPTNVHVEAADRYLSGVGEGDSRNDSQRIHCLA